MDSGRALGLLDNMLWTSLIVAGPILLAILVVGLLISIFQVTTQLQEMTLSYVPKMLVTAGLLILLGPWMIATLTHFAIGLYSDIPALAGL
ncbi:MAG TPA: flagellar biosynthetic protein FliQ [Sphingomicrobium sp.]|nr:flagellar biosynthetic protein FliQ [Sphingomicrobium sp.]